MRLILNSVIKVARDRKKKKLCNGIRKLVNNKVIG